MIEREKLLPRRELSRQRTLLRLKVLSREQSASVSHEFQVGRARARRAVEGRPVEPVNEKASLLKLRREEEGRGDLDPSAIDARGITAAPADFVGPIS